MIIKRHALCLSTASRCCRLPSGRSPCKRQSRASALSSSHTHRGSVSQMSGLPPAILAWGHSLKDSPISVTSVVTSSQVHSPAGKPPLPLLRALCCAERCTQLSRCTFREPGGHGCPQSHFADEKMEHQEAT